MALSNKLLGSTHWGMLGGIVGMWIMSKFYKFHFLECDDFFAPFCAIGYAFARIGCYFAGCCRGIETNVLWSVVFPHTQISVHPVQLYDSYLNFLLFLFLIEYRDKKRFEGELFLLFLLGNSIIRFFVEYFRWGVSAKVVAGFITQAQIASIVIILGSLVFWKILKEKQKIV
ncbi:MAG: prolipoprotein diacylglyceryl transferase [Candidatus Aenigmatarchaeota archaeon]